MLLAILVLATGCGGAEQGSIARDFDLNERRVTERGGGSTTRFVVGSKDFAEQEILGQITIAALRAAGAEVIDRTGLGDTDDVRDALLASDIDLYWEYTGTGMLIHLAQPVPADPAALYPELDRLDRERNGIAWLEPAPANNTYALAVREDVADPDLAAVATISDLRALTERAPEKVTLCAGPEFSERADGLPGLAEHYGWTVPPQNVAVLPDDTVYGAVDEGARCNVGSVFETNGLIDTLGLRLLTDDLGFFAPYNPSVTLPVELLESSPDLAELFGQISPLLDTPTLRELSVQVLVEGREPDSVAQDWLRGHGLI